jgi:nucleoside-diphosphate-sugar epimerase
METSDVVLVTGATGGVGRRVVNVLRKKGMPVRVLVFHLLSVFENYTLWHLIA